MKKLIVAATGYPATNLSWRWLAEGGLETMMALAQVCGDKTILFGIENVDGVLTDGLLAVDGELIVFNSAPIGTDIVITTSTQTANYNTDLDNPTIVVALPTYITKTATIGSGIGSISLDEFKRIKTLRELSDLPPNALTFLKKGSLLVGSIPNTGIQETITFPDLGTDEYYVLGSFKSEPVVGEDVEPNSVAWEWRNATATSFDVRATRTLNTPTNYTFYYTLIPL
jgi:hypothetical protein